LDWEGFSPEVLAAGRAAWAATEAAKASSRGADWGGDEEGIAPNRESIQRVLEKGISGRQWQKAQNSILDLGPAAIGPLLEILGDGSVLGLYRTAAGGVLLIFGAPDDYDRVKGHDRTIPIELRRLGPRAGEITDAILDYSESNSKRMQIGSLDHIAPLDRIPRILGLMETSSGEQQAGYIHLFSQLTYTKFPTATRLFCGNSTAESMERARQESQLQQQESVRAIRDWWAEHGSESPAEWAEAAVVHDVRVRS
jgi:hypothetical protein